MVVHPKLTLDHLRDAAQGPSIRRKISRRRTAPQQASQGCLVIPRQLSRSARGFAPVQGSQTAAGQAFGQITDRRPADAQLARYLRLRQPARPQQLSTFSTTVFHLFAREVFRFPCHVPKCKPI
jgi:hypothetical protein